MTESGGGCGDVPARVCMSVYDTGLNSEDDGVGNLRVKEVDTVYKKTAVQMSAKQPYATRSLKPAIAGIEAGTSAGSKQKKRKKQGGGQHQVWTRKITRTQNAEGEEHETISMYLRSADTVIDVSIKSPAKKKKTARRQCRVSDSATSTGTLQAGTTQCTASSETLEELNQSGCSKPVDHERTQSVEEDAENSAKTQLLDTSVEKPGTEVARRSLHKILEAEEQPLVPATATCSAAGEGFSFPGVDAQDTSGIHAEELADVRTNEEPVKSTMAAEDNTLTHPDLEGPGVQRDTVSADEPSLNIYAEDSHEEGIKAILPAPIPAQVQGRDQGVRTTHEAQPETPLASDIQVEAALELTNVDTHDAGGSQFVSQHVETETNNAMRVEFPPTEVVPDPVEDEAPRAEGVQFPQTGAEMASPPVQTKPKPCQLTVADCLKEYRARSRSPSPMPQSALQGTPSSRPPRHSQSRGNTSPPVKKLVPTMSPSKSTAKGEKAGEQKLYLDAILSKLSPLEQARYLRAKAEMLEEKLGGAGADEGQTRSPEKSAKSRSKTQTAATPPEQTKQSKKELRRQRKAAKKQAEMESIEQAMRDLEKKKALLEAGGTKKSKSQVPSPRESRKGQPSKRTGHTRDTSKEGLQVSPNTVGRKNQSHSIDSSPLSLPSESNVINDFHSIGVWDTVKDVPPCEVNAEGQPIGRFWKHMQSYTHNRAPWIFPWDVSWPSQDKALKRAFANRVMSLYPGNYDIDYVLEDVATNIRQRRQRTRNHMKKHNSKKFTPIAHGLTVKAWNNIWASISNQSYQEKSNKCKKAANARTERMGYTHRLGSLGVAGLIKKFEDEFKRVPTEDEVIIAKREGFRPLFDMTRKRYKENGGEKDKVLAIKEAPTSKSGGHKRRTQKTQTSDDTEEESARTSSDDEEEGDSVKEASSGGSGSTKTGSSEEDGENDREDGDEQSKGCGSDREEDTHREEPHSSSDDGSADDRD